MNQGRTVLEAATIIGISPRLLRTYITEQKIGVCRYGRKITITDSQIASFQARHEVKPRNIVDVSAPNPEYRIMQPAAS